MIVKFSFLLPTGFTKWIFTVDYQCINIINDRAEQKQNLKILNLLYFKLFSKKSLKKVYWDKTGLA